MYCQNPKDDAKRAIRAILTDQLARWLPGLYVRLTGQTGRGALDDSPPEAADYFKHCFAEYFDILQVRSENIPAFLSGKQVLEYGPGDVPGVALLMVAHGAVSVTCVDRFPLLALSPKNIEIIELLLDSLSGEARLRAEDCFLEKGRPSSGFSPRINYLIRPSGLSGLCDAVDLVISRAVLEHVNDLFSTFADMHKALRNGCLAVHEVDLKSHGLHRKNPLDFLTWPPHLWSWMYAHKGVPNRWRVNHYREVISATGFKELLMRPTLLAEKTDMAEVRPYLALPFKNITDEDLAWLGFWMVLKKEDTLRAYVD
jgi:hypothetical protein